MKLNTDRIVAYGIATIILSMTLCCRQTPSAKQNQDTSSVKSGASPAIVKAVGTPAIVKAANPPETVSEISALIVSPKTKGSGVVTITAKSGDCSSIQVSGQVNVGHGYRGNPNDLRGVLFLPGVKHKFIGQVCLFTAGTQFTTDGYFLGNVEYGEHAEVFSGGALVGPVKIQLTVNLGRLDVTGKSKLFQIVSTASDPLILQVTPSGYTYVAGTGTLRTPTGKKFSFQR